MKKVELSKQLSLSQVVQGFWRLDGWNMSDKELAAFMNECIDRGVTSFDTAEIYADTLCETLMGRAFKADPTIRGRIELVSKTGIFKENGFGYYNTSYDRVLQSCHESLERLGTLISTSSTARIPAWTCGKLPAPSSSSRRTVWFAKSVFPTLTPSSSMP